MKKYQLSSQILIKYFIYGLLLLFASCKTAKTGTNLSVKKNASVKQLIALHNKTEFNFNTLQSRLKVDYNGGSAPVSPSVTLRVEKNKQIWMSAKVLGFGVAKMYITPTSVAFYEKINKKYFKGNFEELSAYLGSEVDFNIIQNILTGQSIFDLKPKEYIAEWQAPDQFIIEPKVQNEKFDMFLKLFQKNLKVAGYKISKSNDKKYLSVTYEKYQTINNQFFPEILEFNAVKPSKNLKLNVEFRGVQLNETLSFPFKIPDGYTKISIPEA